MSGITDRIAEVLGTHRWMAFSFSWDVCTGCDWRGKSRDGHVAHVAEVLVAELGLTEDHRTLPDGMGGISTNYLTGETTSVTRPCTRQRRYVTAWEPAS